MQLIADPQSYDGQIIQVEGFVSFEFEDYGLYFTRDAYEHLDSDNAVWLEFAPNVLGSENQRKQLQGKYVLIEGTFDARHKGHLGAFAGEVVKITRIQPVFTRQDFTRRQEGAK